MATDQQIHSMLPLDSLLICHRPKLVRKPDILDIISSRPQDV